MTIMKRTLRETISDYEIHIPMTYQEYVDAFDEDVHAEWVQGEAIIFARPSTRHQAMIAYLIPLLGCYVEYCRLGQLILGPYEMKTSPTSSARVPDILFVKSEHKERLEEQRLAGAADLVIEVVSPESVKRDNEDKFTEYEAAGVKEYWIIDSRSEHKNVEFWVLDAQGRYKSMPVVNNIYHSTVLSSFWLNTDWLWDTERYRALAAFAEIAKLPKEMVKLLKGGSAQN